MGVSHLFFKKIAEKRVYLARFHEKWLRYGCVSRAFG